MQLDSQFRPSRSDILSASNSGDELYQFHGESASRYSKSWGAAVLSSRISRGAESRCDRHHGETRVNHPSRRVSWNDAVPA